MAGVVAVVLAVLELTGNSDSSTQRDPPPANRGTPSARVSVHQSPENAVFPVAPERLPTPPRYVPDPEPQQESHCVDWAKWLRSQRAAMLSNPGVAVDAPAQTAASVRDVRVRVHHVERPTTATVVQCHEGAGGEEATYLDLQLDRPDKPPVLVDYQKGGEIGSMPDAVFTVPAGRTETLSLRALGRPGTFYEWSVEVDVVVDKVTRTEKLGSADLPFRSWIGDLPGRRADYDVSTSRWEPVP